MDLQIGSHIQRIRLIRGYPQKYMANRLGISIPAYSKLEKRGGNISIEYLVKIAEILEVPRNFIIEFDEEKLLPSASQVERTSITGIFGQTVQR